MGKHALTYPRVHTEEETIAAVAAGKSLARLGDGELKLILGGHALREPKNAELAEELRQVLRREHEGCIVGIPTLCISGPKYEGWRKHADRFCSVLNPDLEYFSAFVSRPDSAPWIDTPEFARSIELLWRGKRAAVIAEPKGFMVRTVARSAKVIEHIECTRHNAFAQIDWLEKQAIRYGPDVIIMAAGPTATCLAVRFARRGIHAIDLGSAGRFIYRKLWPAEYEKLNPKGDDEG